MLKQAFFILLIILVFLVGCNKDDTFSIGIIQTIAHPSLNETRQGFIDQINNSDLGNKSIEIIDLTIEDEELVSKDPTKLVKNLDLILAISSQSLHELLNKNNNVPIIFTAVSDPMLIDANDFLLENKSVLTGVSDMTPIEAQVKLLKKLVPHLKNLGIIFNPQEKLSLSQIKLIEEAASQYGIRCSIEKVATSEAAIRAAKNLLGEIDALYIPSDQTITPVIQEMVHWTDLANKPLMSGDERGLEQGALCTVTVDYYKLGHQTGQIAANYITKQEKIEKQPVKKSKSNKIVINPSVAEKLNIPIPNDLKGEIGQ